MIEEHREPPIAPPWLMLLAWAAALLAIAICANRSDAQDARDTVSSVRIGVVSEPAFDALAADWRRHDKPGVVERGYCITQWYRSRYPDSELADSIVRVTRVERAVTDGARSNGINMACPQGTPTLHTHPLDDGYPNCDASKPDFDTAQEDGEPFFVIQCDRRTFVFFYRYHGSYRK